jgi:hypothetical protein
MDKLAIAAVESYDFLPLRSKQQAILRNDTFLLLTFSGFQDTPMILTTTVFTLLFL